MEKKEKEQLPRPGLIKRFIFRNTPLSQLIKRFLFELDPGQYEFIEDFYLPTQVRKTLERMGFKVKAPLPGRRYFIRDRTRLRMGVITKKDFPIPSDEIQQLFSSMEEFIQLAGRHHNEFMLIPYKQGYEEKGLLPIFCPFMIVVWTADRTPLENIIGTRRRLTLPPRWLKQAQAVRKIPVPNVIKQWNQLSYEFIETIPDQQHRKYYVKQNPRRLLFSTLATDHSPNKDLYINFFQSLGESPNPLQVHHEFLHNRLFHQLRSFTIVINEEAEFRAINYGLQPYLYSNHTQTLHQLPESLLKISPHFQSNESISLNILSGRLNQGDSLLIMPQMLAENVLVDLKNILMQPESLHRQVQELIRRERSGKILLLSWL